MRQRLNAHMYVYMYRPTNMYVCISLRVLLLSYALCSCNCFTSHFNFFPNNRFILLPLLLLLFMLVLELRCKYRCYFLTATAFSQINCAAFAIFLRPSSGYICCCCYCSYCCRNFIVYLL